MTKEITNCLFVYNLIMIRTEVIKMRSQHDNIFATIMQLSSIASQSAIFRKHTCIKLESFLGKLKSIGGIDFVVHENG